MKHDRTPPTVRPGSTGGRHLPFRNPASVLRNDLRLAWSNRQTEFAAARISRGCAGPSVAIYASASENGLWPGGRRRSPPQSRGPSRVLASFVTISCVTGNTGSSAPRRVAFEKGRELPVTSTTRRTDRPTSRSSSCEDHLACFSKSTVSYRRAEATFADVGRLPRLGKPIFHVRGVSKKSGKRRSRRPCDRRGDLLASSALFERLVVHWRQGTLVRRAATAAALLFGAAWLAGVRADPESTARLVST